MVSRNNYTDSVDPRATEIWNTAYAEILEEFGFSKFLDTISAAFLNRLFIARRLGQVDLSEFMGRDCVVLGPAASSSKAMIKQEEAVIVAGSALESLKPAERVDFVVTDLDDDPERLVSACGSGSIVVAHAHGDNIDKLIKVFPLLKGSIVISCQTESHDMITDFGGFTDGDRAVFFAHYLRAPRIRVVGFDFENPVSKQGSDPAIKKKKLAWAKHLIMQLKQVRTAEFGDENITVTP